MKSTLKTMLLSTAVAATSLMGATAVVADGQVIPPKISGVQK